MGAIGDIVDLAEKIFDHFSRWRTRASSKPKIIFEKYVQSSYDLIREVHADYLELYLELEERIALEDRLDPRTVAWFSRARVRRQADRSELRSLDIPLLNGESKDILDVNDAINTYISSVRSYFLPDRIEWSHVRQRRLQKSSSGETEYGLYVMLRWFELSDTDRRVVIAEESIEREGEEDRTRPEGLALVGRLLDVVTEDDATEDDEIVREIRSRTMKVESTLRGIDDERENRLGSAMETSTTDHRLSWQNIIRDHARRERRGLEKAMSTVQRSFVQLRVLTDVP